MRRILRRPNITVTLIESTRRGVAHQHKHRLELPMVPRDRQGLVNGVEFVNNVPPLTFIEPKAWTYTTDRERDNAILAIKQLPGGSLRSVYRLEDPDELDGWREEDEPSIEHTDRMTELDERRASEV